MASDTIEMKRGAGEGQVPDAVRQTESRIIELIHLRGYEPGDRMPSERDLAEKFGVSRAVLREALSVLHTTGMIERRPNSGLFVQGATEKSSFEATVLQSELGLPLDRSVIEQSMEVRRILEQEAVRLACERRCQDDLTRLKAILNETDQRIAAGENIVDLDEDFHLAIVTATQNTVFAQIVNSFFRSSRRRRQSYFEKSERRRQSHEEHKKIFAAIQQADADAAYDAMNEHLGEVRKRTLSPN